MISRNLNKILITCVALFTGATLSYSQKHYIEVSVHPGLSVFRDLATSPLYYKGNVYSFTGAYHSFKEPREFSIEADYTTGNHSNNFNNTKEVSKYHSIDLSCSLLFPLRSIEGENYSFFAGGCLINTTNLRDNRALLNNSFGVENITNLMFSGRINRKFPGTKGRKRIIYLKINTGILNLNYRPGYAYNYMPEVTEPSIRALAGYNLSMNGFRIKTELGYSRHLTNGNIIGFSYKFDVYDAPGKYEPFNYYKHSLSFSLIFNYK